MEEDSHSSFVALSLFLFIDYGVRSYSQSINKYIHSTNMLIPADYDRFNPKVLYEHVTISFKAGKRVSGWCKCKLINIFGLKMCLDFGQ